jgi:hypothetical protein
LYTSCCGDYKHNPNIKKEGHVESQIADLEEYQHIWLGISSFF